MKKALCSLAMIAICMLVLDGIQNVAFGHGGNYRGPAGQVPPTNRTPSDPTPPPTTGGGGTGGGAFPGGSTPGAGGGVAGGGPAIGPRTGPGATAGAGARPGATTPGMRGRKNAKSEGFERWEFWWGYNREPFLNLRESLAKREQISGSADWLLGSNKKEDASEAQRPTMKAIKDRVIPTLTNALKDSFFDVRAAAVIALGKAGDKEQLPSIIEVLGDSHRQVSESAALAIGILGEPDGLDVLRALLRDNKEGKQLVKRPQGVPFRTRAFAAVGIGLIGDKSGIPDLLWACDPKRKESNMDIPICAIVGLGIMGAEAAETVPNLIDIVNNTKVNDFTRSYAVTSLGKIGDPQATSIVRRMLRDKSLHVRRSAAIALGLLGTSEDTPTIKHLQNEALKGSEPQTRNWACISLGKIGGPDSEKTLKQIVTSKSGSHQAFAALGLAIHGKNSGKAAGVVQYLRDGLKKAKDKSVKGAFCISLGIIGDRQSEADIVKLMNPKEEENLRGFACVSLGMMQAKAAIPQIKSVVQERVKDPDLQRSAATALGLMGDKDVVALLSEVIDKAKVEYVMSSAALALGRIGDYTAVEVLAKLIEDKKGVPELSRAQATVALGVVAEDELLPVLSIISIDNNYRALVEAMQELVTIT